MLKTGHSYTCKLSFAAAHSQIEFVCLREAAVHACGWNEMMRSGILVNALKFVQ
jgi:hypothetical protein